MHQIRFCSGHTHRKRNIFQANWKKYIYSYKIILSAFFFIFYLTRDFLSKCDFSYKAATSPTTTFKRQKTLKPTIFLFFLMKSIFGSYVLYGVKDTFQYLKTGDEASFYLSAFDFVNRFIVRKKLSLWLHSLNWWIFISH